MTVMSRHNRSARILLTGAAGALATATALAGGPARAQAAGRPGAAAAPGTAAAPAVVYVADDNSGTVTPITVAKR